MKLKSVNNDNMLVNRWFMVYEQKIQICFVNYFRVLTNKNNYLVKNDKQTNMNLHKFSI